MKKAKLKEIVSAMTTIAVKTTGSVINNQNGEKAKEDIMQFIEAEKLLHSLIETMPDDKKVGK